MAAADGELAVGALCGGGEHMCWQEQQQQQQQPRQQERRNGKSAGLNVSPASLPTSGSFISSWASVGPSKGKREGDLASQGLVGPMPTATENELQAETLRLPSP